MTEHLATHFHANVVQGRVAGHGFHDKGMEEPASAWLQSVRDQWDVACQLGDEVVIVACSTGAPLAVWLTQLPVIPGQRAIYDLDKLEPVVATIQKLYPEVFRCVACNTCTKACPQDLEVMDYIQAAKRGDIEQLMDLSFDCICCGLCAIRCPAEIVQYNVGLLGKRLYGKFLSKKSPELNKRLKEVKSKKFDKEFKELMTAKKSDLKKKYYDRDLES